MSNAVAIGRNIKAVRNERGMTQRDIYEATGISTSQLSAYENGKQMIGLTTLAKLAVALDTSLDRLFFGAPSEAFLNETGDFGETVVNCFLKLKELGVVDDVCVDMLHAGSGSATVLSYGLELSGLFSALHEYEQRKKYYPDGESFLRQIRQSAANEINYCRKQTTKPSSV